MAKKKTQPANEGPKTLLQATRYFADPAVCLEWMTKVRWPNGVVTCPRCGSEKVGYLAKDRRWKCYTKHQDGAAQKFSVKVGTIFEDSPISLDKWFVVIWLLGNCKNGVSSYEIAKAIGVTQKTGWFMLQRIRLAMQRGTFDTPMGENGGEVEADETFIGGLARNMHKHVRARKITGTGGSGKEIVMGLLDRNTKKVRVSHVPDRSTETVQEYLKENVEKGARLNTDELASYVGMDEYEHEVINHAESYVRGTVHTNGLENFWCLLKRGLKGTYVSVEPFHLFRYIDEQAFRYNERDGGDAERFAEILAGVTGRRVTYKQLIGKAPMGEAPTAATPGN